MTIRQAIENVLTKNTVTLLENEKGILASQLLTIAALETFVRWSYHNEEYQVIRDAYEVLKRTGDMLPLDTEL